MMNLYGLVAQDVFARFAPRRATSAPFIFRQRQKYRRQLPVFCLFSFQSLALTFERRAFQ
jgi:hypothetical protein